MGSNLHDVYYCQFARTEELNERHYSRNLASRQMNPKYLSRPVSNRRVVMPVVDDVKKSKVQKGTFSDFDMKKDFIPGTNGPYNGYSNNVDVESSLFNRFAPLQKCGQVKFLPNSTSDLYNSIVPAADRMAQPFSLLQKQDDPIRFNPNECELAKETFHNHTRQDQKNINIS